MSAGAEHLERLRQRRSRRHFDARAVDHAVLARLVEAAVTAPSSTNRQPWRFTVVTSHAARRRIVAAVRERTEAIQAVVRKSHHAEDFGKYGDFFWEPLETAAAVILPQYREYPDQLAAFLESGGADPRAFTTAAAMQPELCGTSAAVMALLLQAHAEGLGACWMAGPMVAQREIQTICAIREPWRMVGAIALGHPDGPAPPAPARKPLDRVVVWIDDEEGGESDH